MSKSLLVLVPFLTLSSLAPSLRADLVGWWPLDGSFSDASGNALDAISIGEPQIEEDTYLRFAAGDTEGLHIAEAEGLSPDVFSLGYRINQDGFVQGNSGLERLTSRSGDSFETAVGDANGVGGTTSPTGTTLSYFQGSWNITQVEIPAEGWVHVVWRNTESEMELYLDGELVFSGPAVPAGRSIGFMNIGLRHNNTEGFEGLIDDVFLWDDSANPLSPESIATIAAEGMSAFLGLDTDGDQDGLPDGWEIANGLDPADDGSGNPDNGAEGDPDQDGLVNIEELGLNTLPNNPDTDGDTLTDGEEVTAATNPRSADPDRDGLNDAEELALGTDPNDGDSDGDSFLDGFEVANGHDPLDSESRPRGDALLILHLSFDGTLEDQSGLGHHGTALGEPEFTTDTPPGLPGGQSLRFREGDVDGVTIEPADLLNAETFTLAYFVNQDGAIQGNAGLERLTSRGSDSFETAIGDANALGGSTPGNLSYYSVATGWVQTGIVVPETGWTHVAWRNSGDGPEDMELFIDGALAFTGAGVPSGGTGLMNAGIRHSAVEGYEGLMDEFRLYAAPLTDDEMAALPALGGSSIEITEATLQGDGMYALTWTSKPGQFYDIQKSTSMAVGDWTSVASQLPAAGAPEEQTSQSVETVPTEAMSFFRVARVAPPALFEDDFESGGEGWTTGVIDGFAASATMWELGLPVDGPAMAHSGDAAYGTDLNADYVADTGIYLRTPVIDFTGRGALRLSFWHFADVPPVEGGRLNIRDASGNLLESLKIYDQITAEWTQDVVRLPDINAPAMIEFEFLSDGNAADNAAGWYIDDVRVE